MVQDTYNIREINHKCAIFWPKVHSHTYTYVYAMQFMHFVNSNIFSPLYFRHITMYVFFVCRCKSQMDWIGCTITRLDQFLILQFTYFSVRKNNFFGILFAALRSKHYHICTKTEMGNFEDRTKRPVLELPLQSETLTSTFQIMVCFYLFSRMHEMV